MAEADEDLYGEGRQLRWRAGDAGGRAGNCESMITLHRGARFAAGYHRDCFVHPDNEKLCIKISRRDNHRETMREAQYYEHLQRRNIPWDMLPRFHGFVQTSLGPGAVFDLVRDADGEISKSLVEYLQSATLTARHRDSLVRSLGMLRRYLTDHRIVVRTLKPKNLVYQVVSPEEGRLFIVDNLGNTDAIPVATHTRFFALRKIHRKWARFERDLVAEFQKNPLISAILREARREGPERPGQAP